MGPSLGQQCPYSSVHLTLAKISPAVRPVSGGHREQRVREVSCDKSEVNRWTMVGYAARLNSVTQTLRFLKESTGHHPTAALY